MVFSTQNIQCIKRPNPAWRLVQRCSSRLPPHPPACGVVEKVSAPAPMKRKPRASPTAMWAP